ncbi:hypothetical protein GW915_11575 [bacterium]|nr:hypothetical protein [bacterium]
MKSFKLVFGTFSLLLGFNSIAAWAADEAADKDKGEKVEVPTTTDPGQKKTGEPICQGDDN